MNDNISPLPVDDELNELVLELPVAGAEEFTERLRVVLYDPAYVAVLRLREAGFFDCVPVVVEERQIFVCR